MTRQKFIKDQPVIDSGSVGFIVILILAVIALVFFSNTGNSYAATKSAEVFPTKYITIDGKKAKLEKIVTTELTLKNEPGTFNAGVAASILNKKGAVLKSGDVFSYNKRIGERLKEKGFRTGTMPITVDGKKTIIEAVGSGVCRFAVVLNTNAERMGLQSVARKPHTYRPSYLDFPVNKKQKLRDATVAWPSLDLKFRNIKKYDIYIESGLKNKRVLWSSFYRITWL